MSSGKNVRLIFCGKLLEDSKKISDYGISNQDIIHAVVNESKTTVQPSAPPVPNNEADELDIENEELQEYFYDEQDIEGTNYDLLWGMIFGYLLSILMLFCLLTRRFNRKMRLGVIFGIFLNIWMIYTSDKSH